MKLNVLAKTDLLPPTFQWHVCSTQECAESHRSLTSAVQALAHRCRVALYGPALIPKQLGGPIRQHGNPGQEFVRSDIACAVVAYELGYAGVSFPVELAPL